MDPEVTLIKGRGTPGRGGGPGGEYWHIHANGKKAGKVFINWIDEAPFGAHASLQIFLNKASQGKGIGTTAYRLACEASRYPVIFAHMRKSNLPSRRAAEQAGFEEDRTPGQRQLTLVWKRK